jgi:hypothetical protein
VAGAVLDAVRKNSSMVPVVREAWLQWLTKRISQHVRDTVDSDSRAAAHAGSSVLPADVS